MLRSFSVKVKDKVSCLAERIRCPKAQSWYESCMGQMGGEKQRNRGEWKSADKGTYSSGNVFISMNIQLLMTQKIDIHSAGEN